MANNGGRQGGAGGNGQMNEHVEFTVKAEEDLYLTGTENTIRRVTAETNYSCLMLKTQRFSSLFRHYAKYHGLRKDDLEYYFVNLLENEDTPESVQLQRGDTIMVRKKRKPEPPEASSDDAEFFKDMKELLDDEEHMDAIFYIHRDDTTDKDNNNGKTSNNKRKDRNGGIIGSNISNNNAFASAASSKIKKEDEMMDDLMNNSAMHVDNEDDDDDNNNNSDKKQKAKEIAGEDMSNIVQIRAHKCILTARAEYFKALFRKGISSSASGGNSTKISSLAFRESSECIIRVEPIFHPLIIKFMLEFIYTNRISTLNNITTNDLLLLLHLSDKWLLRDLKRLVEHELIRNHMEISTVARMYCATEDYHAQRLSKACIDFIMSNIRQVTGNATFQEEMRHYPHLCIPVLKAAADLIPEAPPQHKKQRITENLLGSAQQHHSHDKRGSSGGAGESSGGVGGGAGGSSTAAAHHAAAAAAAVAAAAQSAGTTTPNATTSGVPTHNNNNNGPDDPPHHGSSSGGGGGLTGSSSHHRHHHSSRRSGRDGGPGGGGSSSGAVEGGRRGGHSNIDRTSGGGGGDSSTAPTVAASNSRGGVGGDNASSPVPDP